MRMAIIALSCGAAVLIGSPVPAKASDPPVLVGQAAFGGAATSAPGIRRLIRPQDLALPFASQPATNGPDPAQMPADAALATPAGFTARMVARGFREPRVLRVAPNGDLFVADSGAGEIHVLRFAQGSAAPSDTVFAAGLDRPYGIAFYPSRADPQWVYVANTGSVVRYAYRSGDRKASGAPQTIVADLPRGYHWTRDIAFVAGDRRMLVSVGSNSNIAEDAKEPPAGGIASWAAAHAPGAMWGPEEDRADVLSFTPAGKDEQVFATGLRNCSGLAVEPQSGAPWCVTNERDQLGDNLPPDFATHLEQGAFYGWPWYYIGAHEDPRAPLKGERPDLAGNVAVPDVLIQAHSAPLGIAFYEGAMFPAN
jgi:glucose/arabinose dehydrogenase